MSTVKGKQTRRSVSISGELYMSLKSKAVKLNCAQSAIVEEVMREWLGMEERDARKPIDKLVDKYAPKVSTVATAPAKPKAAPKTPAKPKTVPKSAPKAASKPKASKRKPSKPKASNVVFLKKPMTKKERDTRKNRIAKAITRSGNVFNF